MCTIVGPIDFLHQKNGLFLTHTMYIYGTSDFLKEFIVILYELRAGMVK